MLFWIFCQKKIKKQITKQILTFSFIVLIIGFFIGQKLFQERFFFKKDKFFHVNQKIVLKDLNWKDFDENKLSIDKQVGKNIFVAVGAEWCLTCKFNERIFNKEEFKEIVTKNKIQLYYGDWTNKTPEVTNFLQIYGQQGVPFYIFFQGEEKLFIFSTLLLKESFFKKMQELSE